ncbi:MAG: HmuY family protein [Prevotella sp.]|nr:HmuY family protein [Prevotella sp.]
MVLLSACNGIMDGIYDEAPQAAEGEIYVDATSWTEWHYIKFAVSLQFTATSPNDQATNSQISTYDIPTTPTAEFDADGTGIYNYWYDVFGEGISKRELRSSYPTERQPEPEEWDIAVHRNNVRTNGGAVYQTNITDINAIGSSTSYATLPFVEDEWNETDVWTVNSQMLSGVVGNQRIKINTELSKWLTMEIPPMPPTFVYNGNVFIVRLKDGTYAALRLKNYKTTDGRNCGLTIEYRYPL